MEAAHKPHRSRRDVIEEVLAEFRIEGSDLVDCDLDAVHETLRELHRDFDHVFDFICASCHRAQSRTGHPRDAKAAATPAAPATDARNPRPQPTYTSPSGVRMTLIPAGFEAFKRELLDHRSAHIRQWFQDGSIRDQVWRAKRFQPSSDLKFNLDTGYGKAKNWPGLDLVAIAIREDDLPG